jgi:hypothetical protein
MPKHNDPKNSTRQLRTGGANWGVALIAMVAQYCGHDMTTRWPIVQSDNTLRRTAGEAFGAQLFLRESSSVMLKELFKFAQTVFVSFMCGYFSKRH